MKERKTLETSLMDFIQPVHGDQTYFINTEIVNMVDIKLFGFDFFYELAGIDDSTKNELNFILSDTKQLPAALGGYHGDYQGGLYDHILLVANFTNFYYNEKDFGDKSYLSKALLTAICHDFGKIHYYGLMCGLFDLNIKVSKYEADNVRSELNTNFDISGNDRHVENGIAIIRKYLSNHDLLFDDDMYRAIVFHHGPWSKYRPHNFTKLSSLIHKADMKASQELKI